MRICTTLVAIFAFTLHLMLGCCWHHAHGQDELPGHEHAAAGQHVHLPQWLTFTSAKCSGHGHSHAGPHAHHHSHESAPAESTPSQDSPEQDAPVAPHAPCSDPQCVYLTITQVEAPAAHEIAVPFITIMPLAVPQTSLTTVHELSPPEECPPHLRRHLALSRLLN